jgi:hypothetical protein
VSNKIDSNDPKKNSTRSGAQAKRKNVTLGARERSQSMLGQRGKKKGERTCPPQWNSGELSRQVLVTLFSQGLSTSHRAPNCFLAKHFLLVAMTG